MHLADGLADLARLGHLHHLEPGPEPFRDPWPRVMFHCDSAPNGRVVGSYHEFIDLGPGWYPSLGEAQHADAVATQMAGRGGLKRGGLPAKIYSNI